MFTNQQLQDAFVNSFNATKTNLVLGNDDVNAVAFVDMMKQEFVATANGDTGAFVIRMDKNVRDAARRVNPQLAGVTLVKALNEISATIYAFVEVLAAEAQVQVAAKPVATKIAVAPTKSLMADIAAIAQAIKADKGRVDAVTEAVSNGPQPISPAPVLFVGTRGMAEEMRVMAAIRSRANAGLQGEILNRGRVLNLGEQDQATTVAVAAPVLAIEDAERAQDHRLARAAARNVARMR